MTLKKTLAASAVAVAAIFVPAAHASYVDTFGGVTFTVNQVDENTLTLLIQQALSSPGTWANATKLGAFSFKKLGLDFSTVTATATYLGVSTIGVRDELSNSHNDVDCEMQNHGETGSVCFDFSPDITPLTDSMLFTINFVGDNLEIASTGPHFKIGFVDNSGTKVGSLYSRDICSSSPCDVVVPPSSFVPEPNSGTLALLGVALLAGSLLRRRNFGRY